MSIKRITSMTTAEYQAFVKRLEKRYGPDKQWEELAAIQRPGRPAKGERRRPLRPHSVKLPDRVWRAISSAAKRHGVTASGVVAGLALQVTATQNIDETIDQLIQRGILTPS